jgi:hypothetical protein
MSLVLPAYEFPRAMPLLNGHHPFESAQFEPMYGVVRAPTRGSRVQVANVTPTVWAMEFTSHLMEWKDAQAYLAWLQSLRGGARQFKAWHPLCKYPQEYPDGWGDLSFDGTGTLSNIATARDQITVGSVPSGMKLTPGDMVSIPLGSTGRSLHRIMESATVSGGGSVTLRVEPIIPIGLTVTSPAAEVLFEKPWCLAVVEAESIRGPWQPGQIGRVSFSAVSTF